MSETAPRFLFQLSWPDRQPAPRHLRVAAAAALATALALGPGALPARGQEAGQSQEEPAEALQPSGFLKDYGQLKPAGDRKGLLLYLDRSGNYRSCAKVMFDPVEVFPVPNPGYRGVQPDALKRMADSFVMAFKAALEPEYQLVDAPGPDVLRVRAAISGVQMVKPSLKVTDFVPLKAVANLTRKATGNSKVVAEMSAEMEVLDNGGKRVAAAVATRKGDRQLKQGADVTWKDLESIVTYWAKGFRQRLDEVRGIKD